MFVFVCSFVVVVRVLPHNTSIFVMLVPDNTIVDKLRLRGSEINEQIYYLKNPRGLTGTYG